jgi:hypothetical protein
VFAAVSNDDVHDKLFGGHVASCRSDMAGVIQVGVTESGHVIGDDVPFSRRVLSTSSRVQRRCFSACLEFNWSIIPSVSSGNFSPATIIFAKPSAP